MNERMVERMSDIFETQLRTYRKLYTVDYRSFALSLSLFLHLLSFSIVSNCKWTLQTKSSAMAVVAVVATALQEEAINSDLLSEGVTF